MTSSSSGEGAGSVGVAYESEYGGGFCSNFSTTKSPYNSSSSCSLRSEPLNYIEKQSKANDTTLDSIDLALVPKPLQKTQVHTIKITILITGAGQLWGDNIKEYPLILCYLILSVYIAVEIKNSWKRHSKVRKYYCYYWRRIISHMTLVATPTCHWA